jgi:short-subunit dehydrogenase
MQVKNKRLLLTGATGGLGRACATRLAAEGASLVLSGRQQELLEQMLAELPGSGHSLIAADLGTAEGRRQIVSHVGNRLDGLINCAGISHFGPLESLDDARLQRLLEVNVLAPISLTRALLPCLRGHASAIVNIGSAFGTIGYPAHTGYCASKHALRGFTEALARELADTPVTVSYLAPRAIATAMNDPRVEAMNRELGNRVDSPEAIAQILLDVLRRGTRQRFVGWPERLFLRLNSVLPSLVDRALARKLPLIKRHSASPVANPTPGS